MYKFVILPLLFAMAHGGGIPIGYSAPVLAAAPLTHVAAAPVAHVPVVKHALPVATSYQTFHKVDHHAVPVVHAAPVIKAAPVLAAHAPIVHAAPVAYSAAHAAPLAYTAAHAAPVGYAHQAIVKTPVAYAAPALLKTPVVAAAPAYAYGHHAYGHY